jgi:hypothetical protein
MRQLFLGPAERSPSLSHPFAKLLPQFELRSGRVGHRTTDAKCRLSVHGL